jgi:hypothetical protein
MFTLRFVGSVFKSANNGLGQKRGPIRVKEASDGAQEKGRGAGDSRYRRSAR